MNFDIDMIGGGHLSMAFQSKTRSKADKPLPHKTGVVQRNVSFPIPWYGQWVTENRAVPALGGEHDPATF